MKLFGIAHVAILLAILGVATVAAWLSRRRVAYARASRLIIGWFLVGNELLWYAFRYSQEGFRFPEGLPLELCDVTVWVTALACLRLNAPAAEFAYFAGLGGSAMALLTPDLWAPLASYPTIYFFLSHGAVVTGAALLVLGHEIRLTRHCIWRAFGLLNIYAVAVGIFNVAFQTNYFYLCRKPENPSLLDWFGPWPLYIVVGEFFTFGMFTLMWLSLRLLPSSRHASSATAR